MKEPQSATKKSPITVVSNTEMATDQQASFLKATDALLIELIHSLDRRLEGEPDGNTEE